MKQYEVIALSVSGKGKNIYKAGDIVNENCFEEINIPDLINGGFIKEIGEIEEIDPQDEINTERFNLGEPGGLLSEAKEQVDKKKKR